LKYFLGPPSVKVREIIIERLLKGFKFEKKSSRLDLIKQMSLETPGYSKPDLQHLTISMVKLALQRNLGSHEQLLKNSKDALKLSDNNEILLTSMDYLNSRKLIVPSGLRESSFHIPEVRLSDVYGLKLQFIHLQLTFIIKH